MQATVKCSRRKRVNESPELTKVLACLAEQIKFARDWWRNVDALAVAW